MWIGALAFIVFLLQVSLIEGKRMLYSRSIGVCSQDSKVYPKYFNVTLNPEKGVLDYDVDLDTNIEGKIDVEVFVYAYGFKAIQESVDVCGLNLRQFCPMHKGDLQVHGNYHLSKSIIKKIPGITYAVPDIDLVGSLMIYKKGTKEVLSCLQADFENGKTVNQTGAKWATAVVAGIGLIVSTLMSLFGDSNTASHISANCIMLFQYFQSVAVVSMQSVQKFPPIASAWAANLAWSMGLIKVTFMQKIFRWYVQSTGGSPDVYLKGSSKEVFAQKRDLGPSSLLKRDISTSLRQNNDTIILRGIKRMGYENDIEASAIVPTGLTFFVLCGYLLAGIIIIMKLVVEAWAKSSKRNPTAASFFRNSFNNIIKGTLLRYLFIGLLQLLVLSLWEFTQQDSPALIVIAVLFIVLLIAVFVYSFYKVFWFGVQSSRKHRNPATLLYGDTRVLNKFGFCYTHFHADKYWFSAVAVGYIVIKAIFVGLCQGSGKTSSFVIWLLDMAYSVCLFVFMPYLNLATNILHCTTSIVVAINSFLVVFFSGLFTQPSRVSSVMGWVFFILNAAYSACLLILILIFLLLAFITKNLDARFAPASDDRASFREKNNARYGLFANDEKSNELLALGQTAQDHDANWKSDMYKTNGSVSDDNGKEYLTPRIAQANNSSTDEDVIPGSEGLDEDGAQHGSKFGGLKRAFSKLSRNDSRKGGADRIKVEDDEKLLNDNSYSND